jgi:hypothetical protein
VALQRRYSSQPPERESDRQLVAGGVADANTLAQKRLSTLCFALVQGNMPQVDQRADGIERVAVRAKQNGTSTTRSSSAAHTLRRIVVLCLMVAFTPVRTAAATNVRTARVASD